MTLLVLGHVEPHHRALVVEHELGEGAGELGLADAGLPRKTNEPIGSVRVLQAFERARWSAFEDRLDGGVLADDAPVQALLHVDQLLGLALEQARDGDLVVHEPTTAATSSSSTSSFTIGWAGLRSPRSCSSAGSSP